MKPAQTQLSKAYRKIEELEAALALTEVMVKDYREDNALGPAKEKHKIFLKQQKKARRLTKALEPLERAVAGLDPPEELSDDEALILSKMEETLTPDAGETTFWGVRAADIPPWLQGKAMMFALALAGMFEEQIKVLKATETETK
jgi:hypothetical protein